MWNLFPNVDQYRQERVWDYRDWLPFHFLYLCQLEKFKKVSAYPLVISAAAEPLKSKEYHYRVKTVLGEKPFDVLWLSNVSLKEGSYQIVFTGDSQDSTGATAGLILGFVGHHVVKVTHSIEKRPSFLLNFIFKVENAGRVDFHVSVSGQGTMIWDTVQIVPINKNRFDG